MPCLRPPFFTHMVLLVLISITSPESHANASIEGDLPRRASLGFGFSAQDALTVSRVNPGSNAEQAGLRAGDQILSINRIAADDLLRAATQLRRSLGGQPLRLSIRRDNATKNIRFTPIAKPLETIPGADSDYGVVNVDNNVRLRSIVASPSGAKARRPAVFFVQWVSCSSIEFNPRSTSARVQAQLIRDSGRTLIRVERSASGDSTGPACHELDYNSELEHYYQAFIQLKTHPRIDPNNIIIWGSSLGSTLAPLLAERLIGNGHKVAGVMVQGGGALTYFERMLNFERIYLERQYDKQAPLFAPAQIHSEFLSRSLFYTEYLIHGRHPDVIAKQNAEMSRVRKSIRGLSENTHYGRPFAWHQQAAQHNFLKAWQAIEAPVLVVFNALEQFETRHGHKLIVDTLNRLRPGSATFIEQSQMGHSNYRYPDAIAAYNDRDGEADPDSFAQHLIAWLKALDTK